MLSVKIESQSDVFRNLRTSDPTEPMKDTPASSPSQGKCSVATPPAR